MMTTTPMTAPRSPRNTATETNAPNASSTAMAMIGACGLSLGLILSACGGNDGNGGAGSIALADLRAQALTAFCDTEIRCGLFPDQATCASVAVFNDFDQIVAAVNAGKTKYDDHAAAECLAAIRNALPNCSFTASENAAAPTACDDTFKGTLATGASCFNDAECVSADCDLSACTGTATCCAGACVADPGPIPIDGDCSAVLENEKVKCATGSFCDFSTPGGLRCHAQAAAGQPCTQFDGCVAGTTCMVDQGSTQGRCAQPPAEGEPCGPSLISCDLLNDYCDPATSRCVPKLKVGDACPAGVGCADYARCDVVAGACVAKLGPGDACGSFADCLPGLDCTNGRCAVAPIAPVCR